MKRVIALVIAMAMVLCMNVSVATKADVESNEEVIKTNSDILETDANLLYKAGVDVTFDEKTESDDGLPRETVKAHSGENCFKPKYYDGTEIRVNMDNLMEKGKNYTIGMWVFLDSLDYHFACQDSPLDYRDEELVGFLNCHGSNVTSHIWYYRDNYMMDANIGEWFYYEVELYAYRDIDELILPLKADGDIYLDDLSICESENPPWTYDFEEKSLWVSKEYVEQNMEIPNNAGGRVNWDYFDEENMLEKIEKIIIEDGATKIGAKMFRKCSAFTEIIIPEGVEEIGNYAFEECYSLERIEIPETVRIYGDSVFSGCNNLSGLTVHKGVESIGKYVFSGKIAGDLVIPESVEYIGEGAFAGSDITSITFNSHMDEISNDICRGCVNLTDINFSDSITKIGGSAFVGCDAMKEVEIPGTISEIGYSAFKNCDLLEIVTIGEGVKTIGDYAFQYCGNLKEVNLPEGVTYYGKAAFASCNSLKEILVPNGPTELGNGIFYNSSNLEKISLPESVVELGSIKDTWENMKVLEIRNREMKLSNTFVSMCIGYPDLMYRIYSDSELAKGFDMFSNPKFKYEFIDAVAETLSPSSNPTPTPTISSTPIVTTSPSTTATAEVTPQPTSTATSEPTTKPEPRKSIKFKKKNITLKKGKKKTLKVVIKGAKKAKFSVDKKGKKIVKLLKKKAKSVVVRGKKKGKAKITAKAAGKKAVCTVKVK